MNNVPILQKLPNRLTLSMKNHPDPYCNLTKTVKHATSSRFCNKIVTG